MFLHLVPDEKFIDSAILRFQKNDPGNHLFCHITCKTEPISFSLIKNHHQVTVIRAESEEYQKLLSEAERFTAVFVHNLIDGNNVEFTNRASANTVIVWLYWGAELWALDEFRNRSFLPRTRFLYVKNRCAEWLSHNTRKYSALFSEKGAIHSISSAFGGIKKIKKQSSGTQNQNAVKRAMMRADYIIPVVEEDYYLLKKMIGCRGVILEWDYSTGIDFNDAVISATGPNILVGNSAHYTNNHLEIFKQLCKAKVKFEKIIVPLSYGDPAYKKSIMKAGDRLFGKQFWGLEEFLPIQQYTDILRTCSRAFFNSIRQQASCNIELMIYLGARVFLRDENPVFSYLYRKGVHVFSIKDLRKGSAAIMQPISEEEILHNRKKIKELFSDEVLDHKTKKLLSFLNHQKNKFKGP